jgi:hypothetical protein
VLVSKHTKNFSSCSQFQLFARTRDSFCSKILQRSLVVILLGGRERERKRNHRRDPQGGCRKMGNLQRAMVVTDHTHDTGCHEILIVVNNGNLFEWRGCEQARATRSGHINCRKKSGVCRSLRYRLSHTAPCLPLPPSSQSVVV